MMMKRLQSIALDVLLLVGEETLEDKDQETLTRSCWVQSQLQRMLNFLQKIIILFCFVAHNVRLWTMLKSQ